MSRVQGVQFSVCDFASGHTEDEVVCSHVSLAEVPAGKGTIPLNP